MDENDQLARVERSIFDRIPERMVPDLDRITELVDLLGSPQRAYPSIHLTGTNGKTSTARMIDALLRAVEVRTGRYTSPHLESITERIALDGEPIDAERFAETYDEVAPYAVLVDQHHPQRVTFFELLTAMAFAAFADAPVDVAVVEVGMGGTWDATNVVHAPVAVVTPIDIDHPQLGSTVQEIAGEKAGIVHDGATLVMAEQRPEAAHVLETRVHEVGGGLVREGLDFAVLSRAVALGGQLLTLDGLSGRYDDVFLPLHGPHQATNAACALAAVESFLGQRPLDIEVVRAGFAAADSPGRLEVVRRDPTVVLDGAHNPAGARALAAAIPEAFAFERLVGVVGILSDKDVRGVLTALAPLLSDLVVTANTSPRAMPAKELGDLAEDMLGADRVHVVPELHTALDAAVEMASEPGSGVLVTGSVITVGEARTYLRAHEDG